LEANPAAGPLPKEDNIMAEQPLDGQPGDESTPPELHLVPRDTSFEHALDETAPKPESVHDGDGMEIPRLGGERLPIVPEHLRTLAGIRSTVYKYFDAARFHALFHTLRSPKYLVMSVLWALVGVVKLARVQLRWWWVIEQSMLRTKAVLDGNSAEWRSLHTHAIKRRSFRGACLGAELLAVALALVLVAVLAPWWAWFIAAAVAVPPLARYGRPAMRPIVQSAVTTPLVRRISTDAIVRAYEVGGLSSTDPRSRSCICRSAPP
jgi:DNA segregation ATPase FtsK/SpoIIIE, S-DNA-T family